MRNDRWATPEEIKAALSCNSTGLTPYANCLSSVPARYSPVPAVAGGPVLYCHRGHVWHYGGEGHTMFIGTSGSGKSRRGTIPLTLSLIKAGESFTEVDPKGELWRTTAPYAAAEGYEVITVDFRRIFESARFNPLAAPYELFHSGDPVKKQIALELIDGLAHTLFPVRGKADPFWPESARSLFIAAVYALFEHAEPDQVHMASVYQLVAKGEGRFGPNNYLKAFTDSLPSDSIASMLLQSYVNTANDTKAGIRSTFLEGLSMFARSEGLIQMLSGDDLHINHLQGDKPVAIYIILPDETPIYDKLAGVLCSQLMSHYIRLAEDKYNGRLPIRHNFVIEELGNVGAALQNLPHMLSAGRSRNVRVQYVLQSLSQLNSIYSADDAATIISNTDVVVAYRTNNWDTLTEFSRMCGEREVNRGTHISREPLITPSQLGAMQTGQALVTVSGTLRFITWLPDYTEMFECDDHVAPARYVRSSPAKASIFDITRYVTEAKKKELQSAVRPSRPVRPLSGGFNLEAMLDDIDKKIQELNEIDAQHKKQDEEGKYEVVIVSVGKSKAQVVKAIRDACRINLSEAVAKTEHIPATLRFKTKQEAEAAAKAISAAGGIALVPEK